MMKNGSLDRNMMSITGIISAKLLSEAGLPLVLVVVLTILAAIVMCVLNAVFSYLLGIPRIFVTFGTMTIYQGFSFALLLTIILGLVVSFVLNKTYFGRYVFALGGNPDAARLAGINVKRMEIYISVIAGV